MTLVKTPNHRDGMKYELRKQTKSQQKTITTQAVDKLIRSNNRFSITKLSLSLRRLVRMVGSWLAPTICPREQHGWDCKGTKACEQTHYKR